MAGPSLFTMIKDRARREQVYSQPEFWDRKAREYSGSAVSMWRNLALNELYEREQFAFIDAALGSVAGKAVLDVGCGTGRLSRHLAANGAVATGIDFAPEPVAIATSEGSPGPGETNYRVQSVFDISDDEAFDAAVALGNLTVACRSRSDLDRALAVINKSIKTGGRFVVVEPIHKGFLHRVLSMSLPEFLDAMKSTGFRIDDVRQLHFWPARLPLSLFNLPRPLTSAAYHVGQGCLHVMPARFGFGDYKGISAVKVASPA